MQAERGREGSCSVPSLWVWSWEPGGAPEPVCSSDWASRPWQEHPFLPHGPLLAASEGGDKKTSYLEFRLARQRRLFTPPSRELTSGVSNNNLFADLFIVSGMFTYSCITSYVSA